MEYISKTGEIVAAMLFTDESKNRCNNFVRVNKAYPHDKDLNPELRIQTGSSSYVTAKIGMYIVERSDSSGLPVYSVMSAKDFKEEYKKIKLIKQGE